MPGNSKALETLFFFIGNEEKALETLCIFITTSTRIIQFLWKKESSWTIGTFIWHSNLILCVQVFCTWAIWWAVGDKVEKGSWFSCYGSMGWLSFLPLSASMVYFVCWTSYSVFFYHLLLIKYYSCPFSRV